MKERNSYKLYVVTYSQVTKTGNFTYSEPGAFTMLFSFPLHLFICLFIKPTFISPEICQTYRITHRETQASDTSTLFLPEQQRVSNEWLRSPEELFAWYILDAGEC